MGVKYGVCVREKMAVSKMGSPSSPCVATKRWLLVMKTRGPCSGPARAGASRNNLRRAYSTPRTRPHTTQTRQHTTHTRPHTTQTRPTSGNRNTRHIQTSPSPPNRPPTWLPAIAGQASHTRTSSKRDMPERLTPEETNQ